MNDQHHAILETACLAAITRSLAEAEALALNRTRCRWSTVKEWNSTMLEAYQSAWQQVVADKQQDGFFAKAYTDLE